jgi:signal transduction histidine kinase
MRSIRRSLLGYLLLLLAVALGAVGALVDRFAYGAIRTREKSESERIVQLFELRKVEAKAKFDADVLNETKALAKEAHYKIAAILGQTGDPRPRPDRPDRPDRLGGSPPPGRFLDPPPPVKASPEESTLFRVRVAMLGLANTPAVVPTALTVAAFEPRIPNNLNNPLVTNDPRRYTPFPHWSDYDAPRAVARIHEAIRKTFDDDEHTSDFQFTIVASYPNRANRTVHVVHSSKLESDLDLPAPWAEQTQDIEPRFDDQDVPGKGPCRRVIVGTHAGRMLAFWVVLPSPVALADRPPPHYRSYQPFRGPDATLRVYVHHLRPYSDLDSRLAAAQKDRDDDLSRVREETGMELAQLRERLITIGTGTFVALVLGGWFIVARGLSPLRKLSDAVSRVSEKEFRLDVEPAELGHELAPIHARLTQTLMLLQRAFAREKQAVADISHELRTPIASLMATIDVALRKPRTPEQYRTTLEECRLISRQLGQLVERIMTLASLDAGNDRTTATRTDACELAAGCIAVIRPLAAANNLSVAAHLPDDLALETDAGKLREVVMNLLHNAVEYNKPGGLIELTVRRDGATAVFEVRDTGIGMTAEVRERIFERFYRADASRTATGVHAGLGLAIVREYVALLHGSIAVESEPGSGTTFRVTLPLVAPGAGTGLRSGSVERAEPRDTIAASS